MTMPARGTAGVSVAAMFIACAWCVFGAVTFSSTHLGVSSFAELQKSCKSFGATRKQQASMLEDRQRACQ
jgi:hypothetical protein